MVRLTYIKPWNLIKILFVRACCLLLGIAKRPTSPFNQCSDSFLTPLNLFSSPPSPLMPSDFPGLRILYCLLLMEIYHARTYIASAQVHVYHAYTWHIPQMHIFVIEKLNINNRKKNKTKMAEQHTESTEFVLWKIKKYNSIFHSLPLHCFL